MSYCRWSTDNGYCDAYVYEDVNGGWTTHLANYKRPPGRPEDPILSLIKRKYEEYEKRKEEQEKWDKDNPLIFIDHPEAGKSFNHDTPRECADNLERLKKEGFCIPNYVIIWLRDEQEDIDEENNRHPSQSPWEVE